MDPKLLFLIEQPYLFQELPFRYSILFQNPLFKKILTESKAVQNDHFLSGPTRFFKIWLSGEVGRVKDVKFQNYLPQGRGEALSLISGCRILEVGLSLYSTPGHCFENSFEGRGREGLAIYKEGENNQVFQSLSKVKAMVLGEEPSTNWVSFLKTAWDHIQLSWKQEEKITLTQSAPVQKGTQSVVVAAIANRLTRSAIKKSRTAQGMAILANLEIAAIHVLYMLKEVSFKQKIPV
ncbi:hypothetical protein BYT27DRAFT_7214069 [Phlegmacium glaucopus]|nr:hypothetical protein BYT27DRAFT_7214069 [Phlegmacium glaucopus]